jgi:predicted transcriptional regulator
MKKQSQTKKVEVPPAVSQYMSDLGKKGGKAMTDALLKSGEMDERIKKMTQASIQARAMKRLIKQIKIAQS